MNSNPQPTSSRPTGAATYDLVPYPSTSFPQTHPNRLAGLARVFGLEPVVPSKARVLELGCADGSNLLPMAVQLPGATFLGVDYSGNQIATGKKVLAELGLTNIELRHQDILDFPESEGKFDFIIVHGIYSWVPEPVREKILAICSACLADNGVAFVSYNALPGWNMRKSLRDMMLFHTTGIDDPKKRVRQARALLKFLAESVPTERNAYGMMLKSELELLNKVADNYLLHDYLEEENTAFYFHDFMKRATKHGLQYLSEPSLSQMLATNFPEKVAKTLAQLGQIIAQEQYMDFVRNRTFRQTLLCKASVQVKRNVSPDRLKTSAIQSLLPPVPQPVDLTPGVAVQWPLPNGQQMSMSDTFLKAVFTTLAESNARALSFADLLAQAGAKARANGGAEGKDRAQIEEATLASNLMQLYSRGLVEVLAEPVSTQVTVPEKPEISPLARYQARQGRALTNWMHMTVPADALGRSVASACNGTRTEAEILDFVVAEVQAGRLNVQEDGKKVDDPKRLREIFAPQVAAALKALATSGFFAR